MTKTFKIIIALIIVALVALAAGFMAYYFYAKYQNLKKNPDIVTQEETKTLIDKVGKLIELPSGETPTVATVLDKDKLKDQPFFQNSVNGDKVLVYMNAKKAILYRPSIDKIIEVAPVFSSTQTSTANQ